MTAELNIEQFIEDFESSQTPDAKQEVMSKLNDYNIDIIEHKELLIEYKAQIQDFREQLDIEEDIKINDLIDNDSMVLMTCIKAIDEFVEGSSYYVMVDDVKSKYTESFGNDIPDAIKDYISSIKPLVWVVLDRGIGTLKFRKIIDYSQLENFKK